MFSNLGLGEAVYPLIMKQKHTGEDRNKEEAISYLENRLEKLDLKIQKGN